MDTYLINKLKKIINLNVIVIVNIFYNPPPHHHPHGDQGAGAGRVGQPVPYKNIYYNYNILTYCYIIREREQGEWDNPFQPEGEISQDAEVSQTIMIS